jgi:ABC-type antimicrobial peptide transport system permease subunit
MIYVPLAQRDGPLPQKDFYIGVRPSAGSPELLERSVATAIRSVSQDVAFTFQPLAQQVRDARSHESVVAAVSGLFGGLALLLAALGVYGLTVFSAARRRAEIGIRLALGATAASVIGLILRQALALAGIGVVVGISLSLGLSTLLASLLYGLGPRDLSTYILAVLTLAAASAMAASWPAWRASRIDPASVLRSE